MLQRLANAGVRACVVWSCAPAGADALLKQSVEPAHLNEVACAVAFFRLSAG